MIESYMIGSDRIGSDRIGCRDGRTADGQTTAVSVRRCRVGVAAGDECALRDPQNAYGCFWNATKQGFQGPGCIPADPVQCSCLHLTGAPRPDPIRSDQIRYDAFRCDPACVESAAAS